MASKINWVAARAEWEFDPNMTLAGIARKYKVSQTAVQSHRKKEGWEKLVKDETATGYTGGTEASVAETVQAEFGEQTVPIEETATGHNVLMQQRLAELEDELSRAKETIAELEPSKHRELYDTPAQVADFLGEERVNELVELSLGEHNIFRIRQGLPPYDWKEQPELFERKRSELLQEFVDRRTKFAHENNLRTIKMEFNGNIIAVPVEWQIGDEAGTPGAQMRRMRKKGARLIDPYICQRGPCWAYAEVDQQGNMVWQGYCSQDHMLDDPYIGERAGDVTRTQATRISDATKFVRT